MNGTERAGLSGHPSVAQRSVREQIMTFALEELPAEACGFVLDNGFVVRCKNVDDAPYYRFRIDPAQAAEWWATDRVTSVWHSHPTGPAVPSPADVEQAPEDVLFLVYSVEDEDLGTYVLDGGVLRMLGMESPE